MSKRRGSRPRLKKRTIKKAMKEVPKELTEHKDNRIYACPNCIRKHKRTVLIDVGMDNLTGFWRDSLVAMCPACGFESVYRHNDEGYGNCTCGKVMCDLNLQPIWMPLALKSWRKICESYPTVREPEDDDGRSLTRPYVNMVALAAAKRYKKWK